MITEEARRAHQDLEGRLRRYVSRRVAPSEVEDVLQDVFLRMQVALPALSDEERFAPWLYRIAKSAIVESYRQRSRHPLPRCDEPAELAAELDSSEPSALEQMLAAYTVASVARLPSPYREALTLTELEGATQKAAADALGISLSGMKSRVQRGREKLRGLLEDCCRIGVDSRGRVISCEPREPSACRCRST